MLGILTEKPSQAKNFATALGGMKGSFEGTNYVITNVRGHLMEMVQPHEMVSESLAERYRKWSFSALPWNPNDLSWKLKPAGSDARSQLKVVKDTLSQCDEILIATDCDPSGEGGLLAYESLAYCKLTKKPALRAYFEDESPASLQKAVRERKPIDYTTWDELLKATFRQKWDFLSIQWTRVASLASGQRGYLRQGRLKSAMVLIVGRMLDDYNNYVKKPYFQNRFQDENGIVYTNSDEPKFEKKSDVTGDFHASDVVCDSKAMKHTAPPRLIDLASLSARLAPKGISSDKVLKICQSLYEHSFASYPRSEDLYITSEQFKELLPLVDKIAKVVGVDSKALTHRSERKTHIKSGMAHGANRPGKVVPDSLAALDEKFGYGAGLIYETLARSFLAIVAEDYEYEHQEGHVKDYPKFVGSANVPKVLGWKEVFNVDDDDDASKGLGTKAEPFIYEGKNKRPPHPTQKNLFAMLAKLDIGTGATRLSTLSQITNQKAKYPLLKDTRGKLTFAEYGEMSYLMLPDTHIGDLTVTKRVQEQMADVAKGADADKYLAEVAEMIMADIDVMKKNGIEMRSRLNLSGSSAQFDTIEFMDANGVARKYRGGFCGHAFTDEENAALQRGETIEFDDAVSKSGNKFHAKGSLGEDPKYGYGFRLAQDGVGQGKVSGTYTGKDKKLKGKDVSFKGEFSGHKFSDNEIALLLAGETIAFPATSKAGKDYMARGKLGMSKYKGKSFVGFVPEWN